MEPSPSKRRTVESKPSCSHLELVGSNLLHDVTSSETSGSLNDSKYSQRPSGKPDTKLGTSNFIELLGTKDESFYIDKTNLMDVFLNYCSSRVLVTAPRRFGKTINLAMMIVFFQLQVSAEEYKTLSEDELQKKVEKTAHYKLFQEHQLEITKNSDLMKKHFGKYPVVHISFKCDNPIISFSHMVAFYSHILSEAFQTHQYLISEKTLSQREKEIYIKWLNNDWKYDRLDDQMQISTGLKTLVKYVFKNFNKRIVLLIDEYDSAIINAILNVNTKNELKYAIDFCTGMIQAAVKENVGENWVEYAFITGISHISGVGLSGSNVQPFKFLENNSFVPYYGLTTTELRHLLTKTYQFNDQQITDAEKKCNGYSTIHKVKICNIWSVLSYARNAEKGVRTYEWQDTGYIVGFKEAFRFPKIMQTIQTKLLLDKPIEIKQFESFNVEDILMLAEIVGNINPQNVEFANSDLFFSFILEQGYLSFVADKPGLVVLPNEQIKEQIKKKIEGFKIKVFGRNNMATEDCREFFLKISKQKCDHDDFKTFHASLEAVLQKYAAQWIKKNEDNIRCTIKMLINDLGFKESAEVSFKFEDKGEEHKRKIDCLIIKDDFLMLIETKYKESNEKAMLCIRDRNYLKVRNDKNIIRNPITRFVLMGINMDENGQVSIGYLQDNEDFDAMTLIP